MKQKQPSPTTPTSGDPTSNPFSWSPGYKPTGKECDHFGADYKAHYATLPKQYPTIFELSSKDHAEACARREIRKKIGLSLPELASIIGYSPSSILAMERGYDRNGKALSAKKQKRYMWALIGLDLYMEWQNGKEENRQDAQGDARVQARQSAPGDRKAGEKGRQGHKPKAGDRHRFERSKKSRRTGRLGGIII